MGAMQAQDYAMAKWAIGTRISELTDENIEASLNKGEIIRTHLMRPTWHFVATEDVYWMLELTAPHIKSAIHTRHQQLGFSEDIMTKSSRILTKALEKAGSLTRVELSELYRKNGIRTDENRLSHLMLRGEMDGIVCSGPVKNGKQTYALLKERVPKGKILTREESLAELAKRYFTSHGPATLQDFAWWSGLYAGEMKLAMELIRRTLHSETSGTEKYWFKENHSVPVSPKNSVFLLPAFDEFLVSYKDRSASLSPVNNPQAVSNNGIFYPVIVVDGKVTGHWTRKKEKSRIMIELSFFSPLSRSIRNHAGDAAKRYARFLGIEKESEIVFKE